MYCCWGQRLAGRAWKPWSDIKVQVGKTLVRNCMTRLEPQDTVGLGTLGRSRIMLDGWEGNGVLAHTEEAFTFSQEQRSNQGRKRKVRPSCCTSAQLSNVYTNASTFVR